MKRMLVLGTLLLVLMALLGCSGKKPKAKKDAELNLSGLLTGWTYHNLDVNKRQLDLEHMGATISGSDLADIQTGTFQVAKDDAKIAWFRFRDEQYFLRVDKEAEGKLVKLVLRMARARLNELENEADLKYNTVDKRGEFQKINVLENVYPPTSLAKPVPQAWYDQYCTLEGISGDTMKGLSFEYRASTGDDWRIDGQLLAAGAYQLSCWDLHEGAKPDIVVSWHGEGDARDIRVQGKGITRDLVRIGEAADYDREIAAAINAIVDVRAGKKVPAYEKFDFSKTGAKK